MLDFIGIGARRAGEDWLYTQLRRHPEIHFPRELELGFWSRHYPQSLTQPDYACDLDWYRSVFSHWKEAPPSAKKHKQPERPPINTDFAYRRNWFDHFMVALDRFDSRHGARLADLDAPPPEPEEVEEVEESPVPASKLGDFSPTYCWFDDPAVLDAIHDFAPAARIFYIIRDPRQRAWEAAEKLRTVANLTPEETSDAFYADHFRSANSRRHGDYARAIEQWRSRYGEQLLVLQYEHIRQNPHAVLCAACTHIGVADADYFTAEPAEKLLANLPDDIPQRASLRPVLQELYAEKTEALYTLTGIDYRTQ